MFAAAGMLLATSCSNDELDTVQSGNEAQVTFSLATEGGIATRVISDGTGAKKLVYAVYKLDAEGTPVLQKVVGSNSDGQFVDTEAFDDGLTETVSVTLAKGQTYQVAFWAQNPSCTAYTTTDLTNVGVSYQDAANNKDVRDAFFKTVEFTVQGNQTIDVELKRPFAQINVGVYKKDWEAAVASGIEIEKSSVVIKNAATSINLLTGEVGDETTDVEVSYTLAIIPDEDLKVDLNDDKDFDDENEVYKWLSMSYILVADRNADTDNSGVSGDKRATLESLQYTFAPKSGNNITFGDGLNSVPVQRNWRTNILGQILTGDIQFNITINPIFDGDINVDAPTSEVKSDAQTLAAALTANEEEILVVLGANVDLPMSSLGSQTAGSGEYKLGGAKTKNITIDLNDKTLNLITSYMSAIGAINPDATITIKNGTMTSFGNKTTTWNINDVIFANCNYVIEDVVFNKEVALTNTGKSVTMNNVTINGTGDYYALWISARGQNVTVDNLTVNNTLGRGIKIDEQYVDAPARVTLKVSNSIFQTSKKAAVMVESKEGAEINWGENNNIAKVTADKVFAVWVDEDAKDYVDKVNVTDALVKVENDNTIAGATTTAELAEAVTNGATTIYLAEGEFTLPNSIASSITFVGSGDDTVVGMPDNEWNNNALPGVYAKSGANVVFKNMTYKTNNDYMTGSIGNAGSVTFEECNITGGYHAMQTNKFIDCTIDPLNDYIYTYAGNCTFEGCDFNSSKGKALQVYAETSSVEYTIDITGCTFTASTQATTYDGKPVTAIDINSINSNKFTVNITQTTATGYGIGLYSSSSLWNIKGGEDNVTVNIIDGTK